jgi:hypothetical protein
MDDVYNDPSSMGFVSDPLIAAFFPSSGLSITVLSVTIEVSQG